MTTVEELAEKRTAAFAALTSLVSQWRATGRKTTTAGITSALKVDGILDLHDLAFKTNHQFWDAAVGSGVVVREQLSNGHWFLLLPGESLQDVVGDQSPKDSRDTVRQLGETPSGPSPSPAASGSAPLVESTDLRLKHDIWTSFVDWNLSYRRFWDKHHARSFLVPASPGWVPDDVDTRQYIEIEPALQDVQIEWMRAFTAEQDEPHRGRLLASLADTAPKGAFRRELIATGLHSAWRTVLRRNVVAMALAWAARADVDVATIVENRPREIESGTAPARSPRASAPNRGRDFAGSSTQPSRPVVATVGATAGEPRELAPEPRSAPEDESAEGRLALLRARVRDVVGVMTWDELSQIPVRAEHLLDS